MVEALHKRGCQVHPTREAIARCPSCGGDFCRECVNDHEGRLLCAACIQQIKAAVQEPTQKKESRLRLTMLFSLCVLALWSMLYFAGRLLLVVPMETHD